MERGKMTDLTFLRQAEELRDLKKRAAHFKDKGAKAAAETSADYASRLERQIEKHEDEKEALIEEIDRIYQDRFKCGQPRREGNLIGFVNNVDRTTGRCECFAASDGNFGDRFSKVGNAIERKSLVSIRSDRVGEKYIGIILKGSAPTKTIDDGISGRVIRTGSIFFIVDIAGRILDKDGTKKNVFVKRGRREGEDPVPCCAPLDAAVFLYEDFFMGDIKSQEDFEAFAEAAAKAHSRQNNPRPI